MHIRLATINDLPEIVAIYNATIPGRLATADTKAVTVESKMDWFYKHQPNLFFPYRTIPTNSQPISC